MNMESNKKIVILSIRRKHFPNTTHIVEKLKRAGVNVIRPKTIRDFEKACKVISSNDIIITLYFSKNNSFRKQLVALEKKGCMLMDHPNKMRLTENRKKTMELLSKSNIKIPNFYFGHPDCIPNHLGNKLVIKHPFGLAIGFIDTKRAREINQKNIYVEEILLNPKKTVRCITYVFGMVFTRIKKDKFDIGFADIPGTEPKTSTSKKDRILAQKVHKLTGMELFNVDLIDEVVIEINCCPNFFLYDSIVKHFVKRIIELSQKQ